MTRLIWVKLKDILTVRNMLPAWTWVWVVVNVTTPPIRRTVAMALWNGHKFLSANGQLPIENKITHYAMIEWPQLPED